LLVPPRDPKALAEALLTLLGDDRLCQRLGRNAKAMIERHHTWDAVGARYVACYEQVLDDQR
jgi:glycosyltransferase involved in cell wall biosynthesis